MEDSTAIHFRLRLDSGETVEAGADEVVLRMARWRAQDLSLVLDAYTRIVELVDRAGEVSGTERGLARALADAAERVGAEG